MTKNGSAVTGIFVSALLVVGVSGCGGGADKSIQKAPVGYGAVTEVVEAPGTITPKSQITVAATAGGTIGALQVEDGQQVAAGQPLLRIDSPEAQAALTQAKAADAQAAASATSASGSSAGIDFSGTESRADATAKQAFAAATSTADQIADPVVKQAVLDQIAAARTDYATASSDVRTTIGNFNKGIASVSDVFGSLSAAQRTQTKAAVAIAQKTVDSLTISAPVAGFVSLRSGSGGSGSSGIDVSSLLSQLGGIPGVGSQLGSLAGAAAGGGGGSSGGSTDTVIAQGSPVSSGATLLMITDASTLTVTAQVDETAILKVAPGIPASIQIDAVPGADYPATVLSVDSDAHQTSQGGQTYRVRLSLAAGKMGDGSVAAVPKPGMTAVVDLRVASVSHALAVPSAAIVNDGNQDTVWLVKNGVTRRQVVRLGAQGDTVVEVAAGLSAGDVIVAAGADKVHDGQKL